MQNAKIAASGGIPPRPTSKVVGNAGTSKNLNVPTTAVTKTVVNNNPSKGIETKLSHSTSLSQPNNAATINNNRKSPQTTTVIAASKANKTNHDRIAKKAANLETMQIADEEKSHHVVNPKPNVFSRWLYNMNDNEEIVLTDVRAMEIARSLHFTQQHLRKFKAKFNEIDIDNTGDVMISEYLTILGESKSPFTDELFSLVELQSNGKILYEEYLIIVSTYCMFTKDQILRFCFDCFDLDKSGSITEDEFIELCRWVDEHSTVWINNLSSTMNILSLKI